jgi:hypothetical protein
MKYNLFMLRNLLLFYFKEDEIIELLGDYLEINLHQEEKISPFSYLKLLKEENIIIKRKPLTLKTIIILAFSTFFLLLLTANPLIKILNPLYSIFFIIPYFYFTFLLMNTYTSLTSNFIEETTDKFKENKHFTAKICFASSLILFLTCITFIFIQFYYHIFTPILYSSIFNIVLIFNLLVSYITILFSIFNMLFRSSSNYYLFMLSIGHYIIMGNIYKLFSYYELSSPFDILFLTQVLFMFSLHVFCIWSLYRKENLRE